MQTIPLPVQSTEPESEQMKLPNKPDQIQLDRTHTHTTVRHWPTD